MMPRLDGFSLLRELRADSTTAASGSRATARRIQQQPWGKGVVLVALTGWGQEEDRRKSGEAGFDSHMVKPIEPAALEKLLASLRADTA
jgi:CheY-like chemotaxis protein